MRVLDQARYLVIGDVHQKSLSAAHELGIYSNRCCVGKLQVEDPPPVHDFAT